MPLVRLPARSAEPGARDPHRQPRGPSPASASLLTLWGIYTVYLLLRDPDELTRSENHPSWRHMYLMMMAAQIGFAVAYLIPH